MIVETFTTFSLPKLAQNDPLQSLNLFLVFGSRLLLPFWHPAQNRGFGLQRITLDHRCSVNAVKMNYGCSALWSDPPHRWLSGQVFLYAESFIWGSAKLLPCSLLQCLLDTIVSKLLYEGSTRTWKLRALVACLFDGWCGIWQTDRQR